MYGYFEVNYMKVVKTKENIIREIAKQTKKNTSDVKIIYNALEELIFGSLSSVNKDNDVCIRLFEGVSLDGIYVSEKTKKNNLTGEMGLVKSKIKPKFNITRSYCDKLNSK